MIQIKIYKVVVILLILIVIVYIFFTKLKIEKRIGGLVGKIIIKNPNDYLISFIYIGLFLIFFVIGFRVLRVVVNKNLYLNIKDYIWIFSILGLKSYVVIIWVVFLIFMLKKYVVSNLKLHFIRFFFVNYANLYKYFLFVKNIDRIFNRSKYKLWLKYLPKLTVIIYLVFQFFYNSGLIYLGFLPYYALYYLILNIINFFGNFKSNFDSGVYIYYKGIEFSDQGSYKLLEYQKFLVLGISEYNFLDDIDVLKYKTIPKKALYLCDKDYFLV